ncbi:MAG: hypothetical protein AB7P49_18320 [Bdellovibrionales bacterium]
MMNAETREEALHISSETLGEWSSLAPSGKPLLVWCLEEGHIQAEEYFEWAKERFQIPMLDSSYFATEFDPSFLEARRHQGDWTAWCYPVAEWEEITYVACVEPPQEDLGTQYRFVLADPRTLRKAWGDTHTDLPALPPENLAKEAPVGINLNLNMPFKLDLGNATLATNEPPLHAPTTEFPEIPEPSEIREISELTKVHSSPKGKASPEAFELSDLPDVPDVSDGADIHDLHGIPEIPDISDADADPPSSPGILNLDEIESPPAATEVRNRLSVVSDETVVRKKPATSASPEESVIATRPAFNVSGGPAPESTHLELPPQEEAAVTKVFAYLNGFYENSLIMKISDSTAKPYRWDASIRPATDLTQIAIDLAYPTFLRIVNKTDMPYHGYLVDSPAHREFFAALGRSELPGCVTAVPLSIGSRVWGVLVCVGNEKLHAMENLAKVEAVAQELTNTLADVWKRQAS